MLDRHGDRARSNQPRHKSRGVPCTAQAGRPAMRLLADRLLATDAHSDPHIARAQELLRVPAQNHMPANIDQVGKCDRFVIPHATWDAMNDCKKSYDDESWDALRGAVRAPIPQCWFELQDSPVCCLFEGDDGVAFVAPHRFEGKDFFAVATLHL